jgi:hypothetical protein
MAEKFMTVAPAAPAAKVKTVVTMAIDLRCILDSPLAAILDPAIDAIRRDRGPAEPAFYITS